MSNPINTPTVYEQFWANFESIQFPQPTNDDDWRNGLSSQLSQNEMNALGTDRFNAIASMMAQAFIATSNSIREYNRAVADRIIDYVTDVVDNQVETMANQSAFDELKRLVDSDDMMLKSLHKQVQQIPLSQSSGGSSRQPKIGEPPEFNGSDGKVKFNEWMNKIQLWFVHEGVATDRQKVSVAMNKLSGAAAQYMEPWIKGLTDGTTIGTWDEFVTEMKVQYGQKDQKEGAKRELTKLFTNKDLATKDFIKYAGNFRTLGRISEYTDELLIDKLHNIIDKDMRVALIGVETHSQLPTKWTAYLDLLLTMHRKLNPEKSQAHIFTKEKDDTSVPMDVDSIEKKKKGGKGKGKEVNSNETSNDKNKYCHICKRKSHNTEDCYFNKKNPNAQPAKDEKKKDEKKKDGKESWKSKKQIRVIEVSDSDSDASESEPKAPKASSSKKINGVELQSAYIEEVDSDDDEPSPTPPPSDKGKGKKQFRAKDFVRSTM